VPSFFYLLVYDNARRANPDKIKRTNFTVPGFICPDGVHGFVMEPATDMKYIADKYGKTHSFIGNADCRILTFGSKDDIKAEVERCMAIGKNCPGFFMACGNHLPSSVPVENAIFYNEIFEELSKR
jgi:uroporphyrinogen-III decarboxylase